MGLAALAVPLIAALGTAIPGIIGATQKPEKAPVPPKALTDVEKTNQIRAAEEGRKRKVASRSGISGSILTSPLGAPEESNIATPSLLGG